MTNRTTEGDKFGYVGQLMDPNWTPGAEPAPRVEAPICGTMLPMPTTGIYFNMDEQTYFAINACSTSEMKRQRVSSMEVWAYSRRNPDYEEKQNPYLDHGKAVHCLVLEGEDAFDERYVVELDPSDFEGALVSTAEIKAAIGRFTTMQPVRPVAGGKQALVDQCALLSGAPRQDIADDPSSTVDQMKAWIREYKETVPVAPVSRVEALGDDGQPFLRPAVKGDWIDQLLALVPTAMVWDRIVADHLNAHEGKRLISAKDERRIRIASHMILKHPDAGAMLRGGYSEVSIFWYCRKTGVPMKARLDRLKPNAIVDLKTFSNQSGMPVDKAILRSIASYTYNLQHVVYEDAVMEARAMIRENGLAAMFGCDDPVVQDFVLKWAKITDVPRFVFIFQQSGIAPVTRVLQMPLGEIWRASHRMAEDLKRTWAECVTTYGCEPWIDHQPMTEIDDELIPMWSTERGTFYDA